MDTNDSSQILLVEQLRGKEKKKDLMNKHCFSTVLVSIN